MESRWEGILASIFNGFWWIFGGKLGRKMEPRSIQEGIEKAMEKWIASRWPKSRNKPLRGVAIRGVQGPGEGVGGGVEVTSAGRGGVYSHPPSPTLMRRGPLMPQSFAPRAPAEARARFTKIKARIDILTWDSPMNCDRGAALNGKT